MKNIKCIPNENEETLEALKIVMNIREETFVSDVKMFIFVFYL